jgi:hypothetical protein
LREDVAMGATVVTGVEPFVRRFGIRAADARDHPPWTDPGPLVPAGGGVDDGLRRPRGERAAAERAALRREVDRDDPAYRSETGELSRDLAEVDLPVPPNWRSSPKPGTWRTSTTPKPGWLPSAHSWPDDRR